MIPLGKKKYFFSVSFYTQEKFLLLLTYTQLLSKKKISKHTPTLFHIWLDPPNSLKLLSKSYIFILWHELLNKVRINDAHQISLSHCWANSITKSSYSHTQRCSEVWRFCVTCINVYASLNVNLTSNERLSLSLLSLPQMCFHTNIDRRKIEIESSIE